MKSFYYLSIAVSLLATSACTSEDGILDEDGDLTEAADDPEAKADLPSIEFTQFEDDVGIQPEARVVFKTQAAYQAYFGHKAPGVDFRSEWVAFYSAGTKRSGGFEASIARLSKTASGQTLKVTTQLSSPGADCAVTDVITNPKVLVKFDKQATTAVRYYRAAPLTVSCSGPDAEACSGLEGAIDDCKGTHGMSTKECVEGLGGDPVWADLEACCAADNTYFFCPVPSH